MIGGSDKAISAGEENKSPAEVAIQFDRTRRTYMPNASLGEALQAGLLNEVAGALARDVVFRAEATDLGLTVTREMQRRVVASEQAFQNEFGEFSEGRFMQVLGNAGLSEEEYLKQVDSALRREQLLFAVSAGIGQPESMARTMTAYELERRSAKLISIAVDPSRIADPDESALGEWYEGVRASYDAPALRSARLAPCHRQCLPPRCRSATPILPPPMRHVLMNSPRRKHGKSGRWFLTMSQWHNLP